MTGVTVPGAYEGNLVGVSARPESGPAVLVPYAGDDACWARPGRVWLKVRVKGFIHNAHTSARLTVDIRASFALVGPGGRKTPARPSRVTVRSVFETADGSSILIEFDVPDNLRSGTIQFVPSGAVMVTVGGRERRGVAHPVSLADSATLRRS